MGFLEGQFRVGLNSEQWFCRRPRVGPEVLGKVTVLCRGAWWESPRSMHGALVGGGGREAVLQRTPCQAGALSALCFSIAQHGYSAVSSV